jgi:alpha-beta hydrolase superfamily lysophospholipase
MNGGVSRLVSTIVIAIVLLVGVPAVFQDRLIYFPDHPPLATAIAYARSHGLAPWPGEDNYRGLLRETEGTIRGTMVLFHGNAGHAGHRHWYVGEFVRLGLRVILAEYPAYGPRAGKLGEAALVADAAETLALAHRQFPGPLLLVGESLGAGVAAAVANTADVAAVLLITPWDGIEQVAHHHYPWLPVGWLLRDRYDSVANLSGYRGRVAVVIAEHDSIVPSRLGRALFESLPEPKRLWTIPGADHNDWMSRVDAAWWRSVIGWLLDG